MKRQPLPPLSPEEHMAAMGRTRQRIAQAGTITAEQVTQASVRIIELVKLMNKTT